MRGYFLALLLTLTAATAAAAEPIKIGDLNSYASLPALTLPYHNGWRLALEQINAAGGVLGRELEVVSRDDGGTPGTAVAAAERLIARDGVRALMGTSRAPAARAVSEAAAQHRVVFLAAGPPDDAFAWSASNRHTFRLPAGTDIHAAALAEDAAKLPAVRWASIAPDSEFGRAAVLAFKTGLKRRRPEAEFVAELWPKANGLDPGPSVRRLLLARPEAIFNATFGPDLMRFLSEGTLRGLFDRREVISLMTGEPERNALLKDEYPEGWIVTGYPWQDLDTTAHRDFISAYRLRFRETPRLGSVLGYIGLKSLAAALAAAGSSETEALIAALSGLNLDTPFGPIAYRAADQQSSLGTFVGRTTLKDGVAAMRNWRYVPGAAALPARSQARRPRPVP